MKALFHAEDNANVALLQSGAESEELIALFEKIVQEQEWKPGKQLYAYPISSVYFGLRATDQWIGGLQLVTGNQSEGLPCLTVWPELDLLGRADIADIALLALDQQHRGHPELFWLLCIAMWRYCRSHDIATLWIEVTPANLHLYRRLGWPLQIAGPLRPHWGELCYPCWMTIEQIDEEMARKAVRSERYRRIHFLMHRPEPLAV